MLYMIVMSSSVIAVLDVLFIVIVPISAVHLTTGNDGLVIITARVGTFRGSVNIFRPGGSLLAFL
jgi:hypothetical protein